MITKDILLRVDDNCVAILEQEIRKKRESGVSNAISDTFIIRLLEAVKSDSKVFLFKMEKNKLIARRYASLHYEES